MVQGESESLHGVLAGSIGLEAANWIKNYVYLVLAFQDGEGMSVLVPLPTVDLSLGVKAIKG